MHLAVDFQYLLAYNHIFQWDNKKMTIIIG